MKTNPPVTLFQTAEPNAHLAVREFRRKLDLADYGIVFFSCSTRYDLGEISREMSRLFSGTLVIGCTTAGQIGMHGYATTGLSGIGFSREAFSAVSGSLHDIHEADSRSAYDLAQRLIREHEEFDADINQGNTFALMLIDGLSMREEIVANGIQMGLRDIQLVGGSAGDDQRFEETRVYFNGSFHKDTAVVAVIKSRFDFELFRIQHVRSTNKRMVITDASPERRVVREIDGLPATTAYARSIGIRESELTPEVFSTYPIVVRVDGQEYVRGIQKTNDDKSLTLYCAIDTGVVIRIGVCDDMIATLNDQLAEIGTRIRSPLATLVFDCIHRSIEARKIGIEKEVHSILRNSNSIGFLSYGEQIGGVHLNQTLTGITIGHGGAI